MSGLKGQLVSTTYDGLIKTINNDPISTTPQALTDGFGNLLPMEVGTLGIDWNGTQDFTNATVLGISGITGAQGAAGAQGPIGPSGGPTGAQGAVGAKGNNGAQGAAGAFGLSLSNLTITTPITGTTSETTIQTILIPANSVQVGNIYNLNLRLGSNKVISSSTAFRFYLGTTAGTSGINLLGTGSTLLLSGATNLLSLQRQFYINSSTSTNIYNVPSVTDFGTQIGQYSTQNINWTIDQYITVTAQLTDSVNNAFSYGYSFYQPIGAVGAQGIEGAQGATGSGAQGAQGIEGAQGDKGEIGAQGAQGLQGDKGETGAQGAQGIEGAQGAQGAIGTGAQGATGAQGTTGMPSGLSITDLTKTTPVSGTLTETIVQSFLIPANSVTPGNIYNLNWRLGSTKNVSVTTSFRLYIGTSAGTSGIEITGATIGIQLSANSAIASVSRQFYVNSATQTNILTTQQNQDWQVTSNVTTGISPIDWTVDQYITATATLANVTNTAFSYGYSFYEPNGSIGAQGTTGAQGDKGEIGAQGFTGDKGEIGAQGAQGIEGAQGAQGTIGAQGLQGDKGETGAQGAQGIEGAQGAQGTIGAQGLQGDKGDTGAEGAQGAQGTIGAQGLQGDKGDTGAEGAQGAKGDTGAQGDIGAQGAAGTSNAFFNYQAKTTITTGNPLSGHIIWNNATQASATSISVSELDQNGDNLDRFLSNVGVGSVITLQDKDVHTNYQEWTITSKTDNTTYWTYGVTLNTSTYSFPNNHQMLFILTAAPIGPQGAQGAQGIEGAQGLQGIKGDTGAEGAQGAQGIKGDNGAEGAQGAQGLQGIKGDTGAEGAQGAIGAQGIAGAQGAIGAQGAAGVATGLSITDLTITTPITGFTSVETLVESILIPANSVTPDNIYNFNIRLGATKTVSGITEFDAFLSTSPSSGGTIWFTTRLDALYTISSVSRQLFVNSATSTSIINELNELIPTVAGTDWVVDNPAISLNIDWTVDQYIYITATQSNSTNNVFSYGYSFYEPNGSVGAQGITGAQGAAGATGPIDSTGPVTINHAWSGSAVQYAALGTYDASTIYFVV
jgi:hypothetical protein